MMRRPLRNILTTAALAAGLAAAPRGGAYASGLGYVQKNLISNTSAIPAVHHDSTLLNPWGIAFFPGSPFWINDNGSGVSALYNGDGTGVGGVPALAVTIPPPRGGTSPAAPTGIVANTAFSFALRDGSPAAFIFAT